MCAWYGRFELQWVASSCWNSPNSLVPVKTQSDPSGNYASEKVTHLPMTRNQLAAIDFVRGMSLEQIMFKYGYPSRSAASISIRRVLTKEQVDERNRRFGHYHGTSNKDSKILKGNLRTKRIAAMKKFGMTSKEIAETEGVHLRTVTLHLRKARDEGFL